jgi:hypothetical protein
VKELENIVGAERFNRKHFDNDTDFADWVLSRARHTLSQPRPEAGADDGQLSRQDKFTMVHNLLNRVDSLLAEARFAQDSSVRHQLKIAKSILRDAEHG